MKLVFFIGALLVGHSAVAFGYSYYSNLMAEGYLDPFEPPEEREDTPGAFQSDILLSPEQREIIEELISEGGSGLRKRTVEKSIVRFWPQNILPYEIHISAEAKREVILAGMDMWTQRTCAQIVPYSSKLAAQLGHNNRIKIFGGEGCASYVGMLGVGDQEVNIGHGCNEPGVVAHEIGHSLGRQHEQARIDRDDFVSVLYENIPENKKGNFKKYDFDTYGIPYDVRSLMHYGSFYFSWNFNPTIVAKNMVDNYFMGNRKGFTFYDVRIGNTMLNCSSHCTQPPQCENEGFVDKNCTCVCKPGFMGDLCQLVDQDYHGPEGFHRLTAAFGNLISPGTKDHPITIWEIVGESGEIISITFTRFNLNENFNCRRNSLVIHDGDDVTTGVDRYCDGDSVPNFTSATSHVLVVYTITDDFESSGLEAHYVISSQTIQDIAFTHTATQSSTTRPATTTEAPTTAVPEPMLPSTTEVPEDTKCENVKGTCGGDFFGSGCIASPNFPQKYGNRQKCFYNIQVASNQRVELTILNMDIELNAECSWDMMEIIPGEIEIGSFTVCGNEQMLGSFVSMSNTMEVKFVSDSYVSKKGFVASFKGVQL